MARPLLVTAEQARVDLGVADAERRIGEWVKAGKLDKVGMYYPPNERGQDLYRTVRVMALAEGRAK